MIAKLFDLKGVQVKLLDIPAPPRHIVEYKAHYFMLSFNSVNVVHYHEVEVYHADGQ